MKRIMTILMAIWIIGCLTNFQVKPAEGSPAKPAEEKKAVDEEALNACAWGRTKLSC
ncbi:MAG TPA: hypothetical protein VMW09_10550 [Desulfatiglandales bacterium]|nr:hypothetical protein [Desulfatiglandales bacterium]